MKSKKIISVLMLLMAAVCTQAKSWKIGPNSVVGMDFASINAAMASEEVAAGDTLFLDQYYNENLEQTVSKQVFIIGTGYDTSLNDEKVVARFTSVLHLKARDIVVKSVLLTSVQFWASDCTLDRCYATGVSVSAAIDGKNNIYSSYIEGSITGYSSYSQLDVQNCVVMGGMITNLTSSIINNNVLAKNDYNGRYTPSYNLSKISNSQITNNISRCFDTYNSRSTDYSSDITDSGSGNTIEHNLFGMSIPTYYPNNKTGAHNSWSAIFTLTGTYSNQFKLVTETGDNPAIGYATDGGDCGVHGGMFGCPSGGRPQYIPYFSKVTVGSRTEDGKLPVSVTIKIQDE